APVLRTRFYDREVSWRGLPDLPWPAQAVGTRSHRANRQQPTAKPAPHLFPRRGGCDPQSENGALLCCLLAAVRRPVAWVHPWTNAGAGVYLCRDGTYERQYVC